ncbi:NHL repeat-containing protein [Edaphobacter bradus]|uniref:hypothetical protein n=1 Tax=Edaphobacter bradus TaxID=2259016 RepID=UPI0021E05415|nr:hypothetical protein [Edaphobacter bradus]
MNRNNQIRLVGSKRNLLALLASSALFTAGCANMVTTAPSLNPATSATFGGKIYGGNQPISGATVNLYYAGQNGLGSGDPAGGVSNGAAILAATTTSSSDGTGSFSFTKNATNGQASNGNQFSCPTAGDPIVYVTAHGGNTLNDGNASESNSAAAFIGIYGYCSQISNSNFINLTEVTTVATMAAITQYFNPVTESVGADGIGATKLALANTINTISNLADTVAGTALTSKQLVGGGGVTVTATPETAKVNTLANVISACVNNASSSAPACTTLFNSATPPDVSVTGRPYHSPAFTPATDTLQALYYIFSNPTNGGSTNLQNLYGLVPAVGAPYQPTLASAPTDWTIAINYSSTSTCGSSSGKFIGQPQDINVDVSGNIWLANGEATKGNLTEISSNGTPSACVFLGGGSKGGASVDTSGNIWYASTSANTISRYSPSGGAVLTYTTAAAPLAVFADGGSSSSDQNSNIYFTTTDGSLYLIDDGATATTATTPTKISTGLGSNPIHIFVDTSHNVWVTSGGSVISQIVPATTDPGNSLGYLNGFATYQTGVPNNTYGLTVNHTANVWVSSNGTNNSIYNLTGSGTNYAITWSTTTGQAGINSPTAIALDGRSNVWAINNTADTGTGLYTASEVSGVGSSLTTDGTSGGGRQFSSAFLVGGRAITVDQSGNVWLAGDGTPSSITEIVGSAVPVYQPYSFGYNNGRFQTLP